MCLSNLKAYQTFKFANSFEFPLKSLIQDVYWVAERRLSYTAINWNG